MVTSFRPKSPYIKDESVLTTTRGISKLSDLYYQYSKYRLEILEERIRTQLKQLSEAQAAGKKTNTHALKQFLDEQERFLNSTNTEIIPDEHVVAGHQPELDIPNEILPTPPAEDDEHMMKRAKLV